MWPLPRNRPTASDSQGVQRTNVPTPATRAVTSTTTDDTGISQVQRGKVRLGKGELFIVGIATCRKRMPGIWDGSGYHEAIRPMPHNVQREGRRALFAASLSTAGLDEAATRRNGKQRPHELSCIFTSRVSRK